MDHSVAFVLGPMPVLVSFALMYVLGGMLQILDVR